MTRPVPRPVFWPVADAPGVPVSQTEASQTPVFWPPFLEQNPAVTPPPPASIHSSRETFTFLGVSAVGFIVIAGAMTGIDPNLAHLSTLPQVTRYLLPWLLWVWLAVLVHELGHALSALLLQWKLQVLAVFPLALHRQAGRFKLSFRAAPGQSLGFVIALPRSMNRYRAELITVLLAGPLATLGWAALALTVHHWVGRDPGSTAGQLSGLWASSAAMMLITIPLSLLAPDGDLRAVWSVWRRNRWAREHEAVDALRLEQRRPSEWPRGTMTTALDRAETSPHRVLLDWCVYQWASDLDDLGMAMSALERLSSRYGALDTSTRAFLWCEVASFNALERGDLPSAQEALRRDPGAQGPEYDVTRLRTEASVRRPLAPGLG